MKNRNREKKMTSSDSGVSLGIAARLEEGERLSEEGKLEQAEIIFREVMDSHPDNSRARNNLACVMWQTRRHEEALQLLYKAIQLDPDNIDAAWNLGQILKAMGREQEACSVYQDYLKKHPEEVELIDEMRAWQSDNKGTPDGSSP
jgi:tetratricopeptide (TPR) repeat protein